MNYANVVVHIPFTNAPPLPSQTDADVAPLPRAWLDRSFTYDIPEDLRDAIRVGQLVWAPFGARRLQGIVVELAETTDIDKTRPLEAIVYPEALLTLQQIELAHWISNKYLAPLSDCIWLFLPPGMEDKVETFIELAPDAPTENQLNEKQRALIERVREKGFLKTSQLALAQRGIANTLIARGILIKRTTVRQGKAKPRRVDTARLLVPLETARAMIASLDRRTAVIRALADANAPLTLDELAARTRVGEFTLARLEREQILERTPRAARYALSQAYLDDVPALPVNQARVCVYLREHGGSATSAELERALEISALTLNALREQGWIEKIQEPAQFILREPKKIPALSAAHARLVSIIELLAQEKNPMWISALYAATDAKRADLQKLEQLGLVALESTEIVRDPLAGKTFTPVPPPTLTSEQQAAWIELERTLVPRPPPPVLHRTRNPPRPSQRSYHPPPRVSQRRK